MSDAHGRAERLLILGTTPLADEIVRCIRRRTDRRYELVGILGDRVPAPDQASSWLFLGELARLETVVEQRQPQRILVALAERRGSMPLRALLDCYVSRGISVEDGAHYYERLTGRLAIESLTPMSVVAFGSRPPRRQALLARVVGFVTALLSLVVMAPVLALIALAIKIDSPGPVLFRQRRVGKHGRPFTLLKFRTMQNGRRRSEWEADNRDHVTDFGRWLRRFRLDELPQFINILRGEMNLVGPRPHPVSNLELFTLVARNLSELTGAAIGCYALRLMVPPGLTGWAQVRYRYANNLDEEIEKLRYDLYYIKHMSPWLDLRILAETFRVLLFRPSGRRAPAPVADVAVAPPPAAVASDASRMTT
jgi:exopolysaccharide biosynthesis polyprenyl glycosylphosphotransferase